MSLLQTHRQRVRDACVISLQPRFAPVDELILRSLQGSIAAADARRFREWREDSPHNDRRYREFVQVWALMGRAETESTGPVPSAEALLTTAAGKRFAALPADVPRRGSVWLLRVAAAAALFVLGLAAAELWPGASVPSSLGATELRTGASEMVTTRLSDGSVVRLAPQSTLRMAGEEKREVWLEGRAFFAVTQQEERPFVVHTRAGDALALGTRFDLRARADSLQLVVVEGRVALSAEGTSPVEVAAGEVSRTTAGRAPSLVRVTDPEALLEWKGSFLAFQSTPLSEVAREIGRSYGIRVEVPDSGLARRTVTASFTDQSLEEVLAVVCRVVVARCSTRGSAVSVAP